MKTYLPRGINYLGDLRNRLRDLCGFTTLAHELIQNADDVESAKFISFDVCDEALIVNNDGVFSDCGQMGQSACSWKLDPGLGYSCDFHRLRDVASGDKRQQEGTTGAFGIGFISVYQITDQPELISNGRHWIIRENEKEDKRIEVCAGCEKCRQKDLPGTRFIFPWARDGQSHMRKALNAEAICDADILRLLKELNISLPNSLIFLKHIRSIDLLHNGKRCGKYDRSLKDNTLIVNNGQRDDTWRLFYGNYCDSARAVRVKYEGRIEPTQLDGVTLAIPDKDIDRGLLFAVLPSHHETGLQFHINADFFTTNDRKHIILDDGYQAEWNCVAVKAAAKVLSNNLTILRDCLGHKRLWNIILSAYSIFERAQNENRDSVFVEVWNHVAGQLSKEKIIYTSNEEWALPQEVVYSDRVEPVNLLGSLGLKIVHSDLRPYFNILRSNVVGVKQLDIENIADCLIAHQITRRIVQSEMPEPLRSHEAVKVLWMEIERHLSKQRKIDASLKEKLGRCAIVMGRDGAYWPIREIYYADEETVTLFAQICPGISFVASCDDIDGIVGLCARFTVFVAYEKLSVLTNAELEAAMQIGTFSSAKMVGWLFSHREEIIKSEDTKKAVAGLPIFPSAGGLYALSRLALPGDFDDPIGIADIVDLTHLHEYRQFLHDLGCTELTFEKYAEYFIPIAFSDPYVSVDKKRKAIFLLANKLGGIRDNKDIACQFANVSLIECTDSVYRKAAEVCFDPELILGADNIRACLPNTQQDAVRELYTWLGVANEPRPCYIIDYIKRIVAAPPTETSRKEIGSIFAYVIKRLQCSAADGDQFSGLRSLAWLPVRGNHAQWFAPRDVYSTFRRHLFYSQANFLDVLPIAQGTSKELSGLNINTEPRVVQVIKHLLWCSKNDKKINLEVYNFLNDNASDPSLSMLIDQPCVCLHDGKYVSPSKVFWSDHNFGKYRYWLGPELRKYNNFFARVGVKEHPDYNDARAVLEEVSDDYGTQNLNLDQKARDIVMMCWEMLQMARQLEKIPENWLCNLADRKVIPRGDGLLERPEWMFFEDRVDLAAKFKNVFINNVILRPPNAGTAMVEAGVRSFSLVVKVHLIECPDPIKYDALCERVRERWPEIARILEAKTDGVDIREKRACLENIQFESASALEIQYVVREFGQTVKSDVESIQAHYQPDDNILRFVPKNNNPPWPAIARELAVALYPREEPGRVALGLKEVLAALTTEEASDLLSELGFPKLDSLSFHLKQHGAQEWALDNGEIGDLEGQGANAAMTEDGSSDGASGDQRGVPAARPGLEMSGSAESGAAETDPDMHRKSEADNSAGTNGLLQKDAKKQKSKGRLRSYVLTNKKTTSRSADPMVKAQRSETDAAGIKCVVEFECREGRTPDVKPHEHPGYDIESKDESGVLRYIEVKSLAGTWGSLGVEVTKTQFNKARELGEKYWLYIVEEAITPNAFIHQINNPAQRVDVYLFDDGWQGATEAENIKN